MRVATIPEHSIGPEIIVGRLAVDDLEDHGLGGSVMIDTRNHETPVVAGFPFGGESLASVHLFVDGPGWGVGEPEDCSGGVVGHLIVPQKGRSDSRNAGPVH